MGSRPMNEREYEQRRQHDRDKTPRSGSTARQAEAAHLRSRIGEHDDAIGKLVAPFGPERVSAAHVGRQDVDWIHHERLAAYIHDLAADLDDVSKL